MQTGAPRRRRHRLGLERRVVGDEDLDVLLAERDLHGAAAFAPASARLPIHGRHVVM
jgi:hypothetical protein